MVGFVFGIIILIIAVVLYFFGANLRKKGAADSDDAYKNGGVLAIVLGVIATIGGVLLIIFSMLFAQDVGESSVLKSVTGQIDGQVSTAGLHSKAPWEDVVTFDIRNQRVVYTNPKHSTGDNSGGEADGREINVNDKDGVATDVDVSIRYNIDPTSVKNIYTNFKTEDDLKTKLIFNDLRDAVRSEAGYLHTIQVLSDHPKYAAAVEALLTKKWAKYGVSIDEVSIQQTVPPKSVSDSYAAAQNSQIKVQKAQNELNATKVSAQEKVVQAKSIAEANNIISASLSPQVLQSKYLDALKVGTVYVVPAGSTPFITTAK